MIKDVAITSSNMRYPISVMNYAPMQVKLSLISSRKREMNEKEREAYKYIEKSTPSIKKKSTASVKRSLKVYCDKVNFH